MANIDFLQKYRETVIYYYSRHCQTWLAYRIVPKHAINWDTLVSTCRIALREAVENGYVPDRRLYKQMSLVTGALSWDSLFQNKQYLERKGYEVEALCAVPYPTSFHSVHEVLDSDILLPYTMPKDANLQKGDKDESC